MKCFFHKDLDGKCSGAIIKYAYPNCQLIGLDYSDPFPWNTINKNDTEEIWMVDFSLQPFEDMIKLNNIADLIWIDHHKTAINEAKKNKFNVPGLLDIEFAACELVWDYIYGPKSMDICSEYPTPRAVRLLGNYDLWHFDDPQVLPFQYGCRMENTNPNNQSFWKEIFQPTNSKLFNKILNNGQLILKYQDSQNEKIVKARSFETTLNGYKVIACNCPLTNSKLFDSVWDNSKYDIMLTFSMLPDGRWNISLYSDKNGPDVGEIAKRLGGGGHAASSGAIVTHLPFPS